MYQQQMPQPHDERSWNGPEAEYEAGYPGNFQPSIEPVDSIGHRPPAPSPQHMSSGIQFSRPFPASNASAGQRLALAIVSVCVLVPLAGIALGILKTEGLIALGIVGVVILGINAVFNQHH
jgi:hypothetical protein